MNLESIEKAVKEAREKSKKRNFTQTFEVLVTLRGVDLKKNENQVDFFATLHFPRGKPVKTCALVGPEMADEAKAACTTVISQDNFSEFEGKKGEIKKLAKTHDFFIAQANIMPKVASVFGRVLGPKGKMPNPKAGCVVPLKSNLRSLVEKLQKTVRVSAKTNPVIQVPVGSDKMGDAEIAENVKVVYDQVAHHVPNETNNIKNVFVKLTMGVPVRVE